MNIMTPSPDDNLSKLIQLATQRPEIAAIWLYGSRAKGNHRADSDYDLGVLFTTHVNDPFERRLRPELLALDWAKTLKLDEHMLSIVDIQNTPVPLAMNIIDGQLLYCGDRDAKLAAEGRIMLKAEVDYQYHLKQFGT